MRHTYYQILTTGYQLKCTVDTEKKTILFDLYAVEIPLFLTKINIAISFPCSLLDLLLLCITLSSLSHFQGFCIIPSDEAPLYACNESTLKCDKT